VNILLIDQNVESIKSVVYIVLFYTEFMGNKTLSVFMSVHAAECVRKG